MVGLAVIRHFYGKNRICVRHYAGKKILDVSVEQPKTCHHRAGEDVFLAPWYASPRQLSGPIVAQEVERHRDTPKFCVRVIFDIYQESFMLVYNASGPLDVPLTFYPVSDRLTVRLHFQKLDTV